MLRSKLSLIAAVPFIAGTLSVSQPVQAQDAGDVAAGIVAGIAGAFAFGGRNYCWYDNGWNGGGWYWCGYGYNQGYGWGGGYGWHGWQWRGGRRRAIDPAGTAVMAADARVVAVPVAAVMAAVVVPAAATAAVVLVAVMAAVVVRRRPWWRWRSRRWWWPRRWRWPPLTLSSVLKIRARVFRPHRVNKRFS